MLSKLQALTNNFTCQGCWQVLTFDRFFDEDHECLRRVEVRESKMNVDHSMDEIKEARAMLGNDPSPTSFSPDEADHIMSYSVAPETSVTSSNFNVSKQNSVESINLPL